MLSIDRPALVGVLAAVSLLVMLYSLVIAQQILLGVLAVVAIWLVYLFAKLVSALGRIARALERLVEARENREYEE